MCLITPFTLPCCRRIYVSVSRQPSCPKEWPKIKCPVVLCIQIREFDPEDRDVGTCWRCKASAAGKKGPERDAMRPGIDKAPLCPGLVEIDVEGRRRRVEDGGNCWFCGALGGCGGCGADRERILRGGDEGDGDSDHDDEEESLPRRRTGKKEPTGFKRQKDWGVAGRAHSSRETKRVKTETGGRLATLRRRQGRNAPRGSHRHLQVPGNNDYSDSRAERLNRGQSGSQFQNGQSQPMAPMFLRNGCGSSNWQQGLTPQVNTSGNIPSHMLPNGNMFNQDNTNVGCLPSLSPIGNRPNTSGSQTTGQPGNFNEGLLNSEYFEQENRGMLYGNLIQDFVPTWGSGVDYVQGINNRTFNAHDLNLPRTTGQGLNNHILDTQAFNSQQFLRYGSGGGQAGMPHEQQAEQSIDPALQSQAMPTTEADSRLDINYQQFLQALESAPNTENGMIVGGKETPGKSPRRSNSGDSLESQGYGTPSQRGIKRQRSEFLEDPVLAAIAERARIGLPIGKNSQSTTNQSTMSIMQQKEQKWPEQHGRVFVNSGTRWPGQQTAASYQPQVKMQHHLRAVPAFDHNSAAFQQFLQQQQQNKLTGNDQQAQASQSHDSQQPMQSVERGDAHALRSKPVTTAAVGLGIGHQQHTTLPQQQHLEVPQQTNSNWKEKLPIHGSEGGDEGQNGRKQLRVPQTQVIQGMNSKQQHISRIQNQGQTSQPRPPVNYSGETFDYKPQARQSQEQVQHEDVVPAPEVPDIQGSVSRQAEVEQQALNRTDQTTSGNVRSEQPQLDGMCSQPLESRDLSVPEPASSLFGDSGAGSKGDLDQDFFDFDMYLESLDGFAEHKPNGQGQSSGVQGEVLQHQQANEQLDSDWGLRGAGGPAFGLIFPSEAESAQARGSSSNASQGQMPGDRPVLPQNVTIPELQARIDFSNVAAMSDEEFATVLAAYNESERRGYQN